ncbi:MAG: hypothetical protein ACR2QO_26435 [Acidimicrobiales bacterium]
MASAKRSGSAQRRQPWDPANGLRVGMFVGALVGTAVAALGFAHFWVVAACATIGGAVGFWSEKRKQRDRP